MENIYQEKGFKNRHEYLMSFSIEYGVPYDVVVATANMLGKNEDFDGLINALEDWED